MESDKMNNGYYQTNGFPGVGLNNNTIPNQQSVPSYDAALKQNVMYNNVPEEQSYIQEEFIL